MARLFNGTTDGLTFAPWAGSKTFNAQTVFAVVNQTSLASNGKILTTNAASQRLLGTVLSNGTLEWFDNVLGRTSTTKLVAGEWYIVAFTKAAGTVTGRFHFYRYSTTTWTHENASGTSVDYSGSAGAHGFALGSDTNITQCLSATIDFAAVYQTELSDADIETAGQNQQRALSFSPLSAWRLDQASILTNVPDLTGSSPQDGRSGTTVADASPFPYGTDVMLPMGMLGTIRV